MTAIPDAARDVIRAALEDYDLLTPSTDVTPTDAASQVVVYLLSSGYTAHRGTRRLRLRRAAAIPLPAYREIRLALDTHQILADPEHRTPAAQAARIAADLTAAGWTISPNLTARSAA